MGLSKLTGDQKILLFTALGGVGFILGYLFGFIGGVGMFLVWSALILSVPAWRNRDISDWSKEIMAQCTALYAFGGMAVIGSTIRLLIEIFR